MYMYITLGSCTTGTDDNHESRDMAIRNAIIKLYRLWPVSRA